MHRRVSTVLIGALISVSISATAETTRLAPKPNAETSLPLCVDEEGTLTDIASTQKTNSKNEFKYDGYKKALSASDDSDLLARLIYAETLAANCPEQEREVLPLIAETIGNRVQRRRGDVKSVIYQRDQFASSLNLYAESHHREFLCPKNKALWGQALQAAKAIGQKRSNLSEDTMNYYLYKHSSRFTQPNWKMPEALPKSTSAELSSCIRFFRNDKWK